MKTKLTILFFLCFSSIGLSQTNCNKVLVCHIPPGNPENMHQICIAASAVPAHIAHGCYVGYCNETPTKTDETNILSAENFVSSVSVFPNPFSSVLNFNMLFASETQVTVIIYDIKGSQIAIPFEGIVPGELNLEWNSSEFANGIYIAKIITPNEVFIEKSVKYF